MRNIYKDYTNDTDTIQSFADFTGNFVTVKVGETVPVLVGREEENIPRAKPLDPPVDMPEFVKLYRDPSLDQRS